MDVIRWLRCLRWVDQWRLEAEEDTIRRGIIQLIRIWRRQRLRLACRRIHHRWGCICTPRSVTTRWHPAAAAAVAAVAAAQAEAVEVGALRRRAVTTAPSAVAVAVHRCDS